MKHRYETTEDAIPYESTVLVLSESDTCFGASYEELFDQIRDEIDCENQFIQEHHRTVDDLPDFETLVQYDIWVVHYSVLLIDEDSPSVPYLASESLPTDTQVVIPVDTDDEDLADYLHEKIQTTFGNGITTVPSRAGLVYYLVGHLKTATACSGAGLEYIVTRNNTIADRIGHR